MHNIHKIIIRCEATAAVIKSQNVVIMFLKEITINIHMHTYRI